MKIRTLLNLSALLFILVISGCKKDDDTTTTTPPPANNPSTGLLTAKINGTAWAPPADSCAATLMNGVINITGIARDGKTITITLQDTVAGTYDLGASGTSAGVYQTSPSASSSFNSQQGPWDGTTNHLTITSIDKANKKMTGTFTFKAFNFVVMDSVSITEGAFNNLPYSTSVTSTGNNVFNVNIDGAAYHPTLISGVVASGNINVIASLTATNQSVGLTFPSNITTGTYSFAPFGTYNAQYNASASLFLLVDSGTLTITEHNTITKKVVGTFNFLASEFGTGTATANLTNGSFTIFY